MHSFRYSDRQRLQTPFILGEKGKEIWGCQFALHTHNTIWQSTTVTQEIGAVEHSTSATVQLCSLLITEFIWKQTENTGNICRHTGSFLLTKQNNKTWDFATELKDAEGTLQKIQSPSLLKYSFLPLHCWIKRTASKLQSSWIDESS